MRSQNKLIEKLIKYGKNHPRLTYPIIALIAIILTAYHGGRKYLYDRRIHPVRQRAIAFMMAFTILFTSTGVLWTIAEEFPSEEATQEESEGTVSDGDAGEAEPVQEPVQEQESVSGGDAQETEQKQEQENVSGGDAQVVEETINVFAFLELEDAFILVPYETEEEQIPFPEMIQGILENDDSIEIPVSWECIDDGYDEALYNPLHEDAFTIFTFAPKWDESKYVVQAQEVPLVYVCFETDMMLMSAGSIETMTMETLFKSGSSATNFNISSANTFDTTFTITGGTVDEPILVITVPYGMDITYYPLATNATLSPQLANSNAVTKTTLADGSTTLTYRFKANVTQVGFNITVTPNYKLKDGETHTYSAAYYDGQELIVTESDSVTVTNPTVKEGAIYFYNTISADMVLNGSDSYYMAVNPTFYAYASHYPYESVQIVVPLPDKAVPGFGKDSAFTAMENNATYLLNNNNISVTYQESYVCKNSAKNIDKTCKVLIYTVQGNHTLLTKDSYISISENIYVKYSDVVVGKYTANLYPQITINYDETSKVVSDFLSYDYLYTTFKEYNLKDYFKLNQYTSCTYGANSYVLPLEYNNYGYYYILNSTEDIIENIRVETTLNEKLYAQKLVFTLSDSLTSVLPTKAVVQYKTKKGGDVLLTKTMTVDEKEFILEDVEDAFTYLDVTYDRLKPGANSYLMHIYYTNREKLDETGYRYVNTKIVSATSEKYGDIGEQVQASNAYLLKSIFSTNASVAVSPSTLNKGDEFYVMEYCCNSSYRILLKNQIIYCLMPKEYIFTRYVKSTSAAYDNAQYVISQREIGNNILYTIEYTDGIERPSYAGYLYFRVGPSVDTSQVRNITLPMGMFYENNHPMFPLTKTNGYVASEAALGIDINGNGDTTDTFSKPYSYSSVTINSVNTLSAEGYLSSSVKVGENLSNEYLYNSDGVYNLKIYNGFASGTTASDMEVIIPLPRENGVSEFKGTKYTSTWDVYIKAPVVLEGVFLQDAEVSYSTDGGNTYQNTMSDYEAVTHIKVKSKSGMELQANESVAIKVPFYVAFNDRMTSVSTTYKAYFSTTMSYVDNLNKRFSTASVTPSELSAKLTEITGMVFKDFDGNGVKDGADVGASYAVYLYKGSSATGTALKSVYSNSSTGAYSLGLLLPGTYTLKVSKGTNDYYPSANAYFNENGEYTFTVGSSSTDALKNVNIGLLSPRTITLNATTFNLVGSGSTRKIVPTLTPALKAEEGSVTYVSADSSVAEVAADGTITWKKEGTTTITVTAPQIKALTDLGLSETTTATATINCQLLGCHIKVAPYWATNSTSFSQAPASGTSSITYYYYYGRGGYCNDSSHTDNTTVLITILDDGGTGATIGTTYNYSGYSYGYAGLQFSKPGTIVLQAEETWGHNQDEKPEKLTFTLTVTPRTVTAPSFSISPVTPDGNNGWYKTLPQLTLTQTQVGTTVSTLFNKNASAYTTLTQTNKPTITESGTYTFAAYSNESYKNVKSTTVSLSNIKVDIDKPSISNVTVPTNEVWRKSQLIQFRISDTTSGVSSIAVTYNGESVNNFGDTSTGYYSFTAVKNGIYTITVTDYAGNVQTQTVAISKIDTTAPLDVSLTGMNAQGAWVNENVTLTISATDEESGIQKYCYSVDGGETFSDFITWNASGSSTITISENGAYADSILVRVYNQAGLYTDSEGVTVNLDKQIPELDVVATGTGSFTNQNVTFALSNGVTNLSGISYYVKKTGETQWTALADGKMEGYGTWNAEDKVLTVSEDVNTAYYFRIESGAGRSDESESYMVKIQKETEAYTAIDVTTEDVSNESGWYQSLTLSVAKKTAAEGKAAIRTYYKLYKEGTTEPSKVELTGTSIEVLLEGNIILSIWTEDEAGNITTPYTVSYLHDSVKPAITDVTLPSNDTWRKEQTIQFKVSDATSGMDSIVVTRNDQQVTISKDEETGYYSFKVTINGDYLITATDNAGNVQTQTISISKIDTTAPLDVSLTGMNAQRAWVNENVTLTVGATDEESGIQKYCYSVDGGETFSDFITWNALASSTITISENGAYADSILVRVYNQAGLYTDSEGVTVRLDKQIPELDVVATGTGSFTNQNVTFALSNGVINLSGVSYYVKKTGETQWTALVDGKMEGYGSWSAEDKVLTVSEDVNTAYYFRIESGAGRSYESESYMVKIQKETEAYTAIDVTTEDVSNEAGWYQSLTLSVAKKTAAEGKAAIRTYYKLYEENSDEPMAVELTGTTIEVLLEGNIILSIWTEDEAGNITTPYTVSYLHDSVKPAIKDVTLPSNDTWRKEQTIQFKVSDEDSGVNAVAMNVRDQQTQLVKDEITGYYSFTVAEAGNYVIVATDKAGNQNTKAVSIGRIDTTAPEIIIEAGNPTKYVKEPIKVEFTVTDNVSGILADKIRVIKNKNADNTLIVDYNQTTIDNGFTVNFTVEENGEYTIEAEDNAGNIADWTVLIDKIDMTWPMLLSIDTPRNKETQVNPSAVFSFTLNKEVKKGTNAYLRIYDQANKQVAYISADNNRVKINTDNKRSKVTVHLSDVLEYDTTYYVKVDKGFVVDFVDNPLDAFGSATEWSFATIQSKEVVIEEDDIKILGFEVKGGDSIFQSIANADNERLFESVVNSSFYTEDGRFIELRMTPSFDSVPENIFVEAVTAGVFARWNEDKTISIVMPTNIEMSEVIIQIGINDINNYYFKVVNSSYTGQFIVVEGAENLLSSFWADENAILNAVDWSDEANIETSDNTSIMARVDMKIDTANDEAVVEEMGAYFKDDLATTMEFFDISLSKYVKVMENDMVISEKTIPINNTQSKIEIMIQLPESMLKKDCTFRIFREHNGQIEELPYRMSQDGKSLIIASDLFSTYAIAYTEWVTVKYQATQGGYIEGEELQRIQKSQGTIEVSAVAEDGYMFDSWSDGTKIAYRTDTNVLSDTVVTANFLKKDKKIENENNVEPTNIAVTNTEPIVVETGNENKPSKNKPSKDVKPVETETLVDVPEDKNSQEQKNEGEATEKEEPENVIPETILEPVETEVQNQEDGGKMAIGNLLLIIAAAVVLLYTLKVGLEWKMIVNITLMLAQIGMLFATQTFGNGFIIFDKSTIVFITLFLAETIVALYKKPQKKLR